MKHLHTWLINSGIKYFINFGRYCLLSENVIGVASVRVLLLTDPSSINDVVDEESDADKLVAFDSLMNKKATSSTNGMATIKYNVTFGFKPALINSA